ncbi:MAG: alpha/beta hydrolase [Eubacteriales bacterium]|nr:alpha/beta hydrolase [Eubacteriales bacterium]
MYITINNQKISYIDIGSGKIILLLHGWACSKEIYNDLIDILKTKYRVLALDLPGFGESPEPNNSFFVDDYVKIVDEFIKQINTKNEKVILLGHSYGGRIIIKLNSLNTKYEIEKNILIDSAGIKTKEAKRISLKKIIYKIGKVFYSNKIIEKITNKTLEDYKKEHGSSDYRNASPIMRDTLVKSINEDLTPLLKNIIKPTLLIWGEKDTQTSLSDAYIMKKEMRDAGLVILKNCTHFSFIEDKNTFNAVIKSFLEI